MYDFESSTFDNQLQEDYDELQVKYWDKSWLSLNVLMLLDSYFWIILLI